MRAVVAPRLDPATQATIDAPSAANQHARVFESRCTEVHEASELGASQLSWGP
ncbi:cytochrome c5 [Paraburkholderia bryophila]|uniref:Cytochrome c5 n=1 Tax=Paraburkholderia bryophila TaxID=420952 RepID=A0A7Y9WPG8_9BURK|nr:cytochrome c5 [Paraburkholderia bryophila]